MTEWYERHTFNGKAHEYVVQPEPKSWHVMQRPFNSKEVLRVGHKATLQEAKALAEQWETFEQQVYA